MLSNWRREAGTATAEFAVLLPAVVLVLSFCLGGIFAMVRQLQAQDIAGVMARASARGEEIKNRQLPAEAATTFQRTGNLICITVVLPIQLGNLRVPTIEAKAKSCALDE